jgi:hypothetical protein
MTPDQERTVGDPVEHFWRAAHEMLMAARALIDAADGLVEQQLRPKEPREPRLRRIDVQ